MFVSRRPGSAGHLEWRIRIFGVGAIVGMVGIWSDQGWLVNVAIAVLLIGFAMRFLRRAEAAEDPDDPTAT
jgi:hypothetical protein